MEYAIGIFSIHVNWCHFKFRRNYPNCRHGVAFLASENNDKAMNH